MTLTCKHCGAPDGRDSYDIAWDRARCPVCAKLERDLHYYALDVAGAVETFLRLNKGETPIAEAFHFRDLQTQVQKFLAAQQALADTKTYREPVPALEDEIAETQALREMEDARR